MWNPVTGNSLNLFQINKQWIHKITCSILMINYEKTYQTLGGFNMLLIYSSSLSLTSFIASRFDYNSGQSQCEKVLSVHLPKTVGLLWALYFHPHDNLRNDIPKWNNLDKVKNTNIILHSTPLSQLWIFNELIYLYYHKYIKILCIII